MAELLRERFAALANPLDDSDWLDVRRRAGLTNRRRPVWIGVAAVFAALAVLLATPALGLRGRIVQLFQESEPASRSVVVEFASLDIGAPEGMAPGVIAKEARKIHVFHLANGENMTLWAAPTRAGGFCMTWEEFVGGCAPARGNPISPSILDAPPRRIVGTVRAEPGTALELEFQDGEAIGLPVIWVSPPIEAGFFLYEVPESRRHEGMLPITLLLRGSDGEKLARQRLRVPTEYPDIPQPTGKRRRLIEITTEKGVKAAIVVAPGQDGTTCRWLVHGRSTLGGSCWTMPSSMPLNVGMSQGRGRGREFVLLEGQVGADVAAVEMRFQDGDVVTLEPIEGHFLYDIPSAHYPPGHRLELIIVRDRQGHEIARERRDTTSQGMYPCDKPVPIGEGQSICP